VSEELDRSVNNPEKACKISAIIELRSLTLLGTVVIFEEVPWKRSWFHRSGRWVVQTRYWRAITPEDSSQQSVLISY
jgi:hypothetical protein